MELIKKGYLMFEEFREEMTLDGKTLVLETGVMARQALGSVVATLGDTVVHAAVTSDLRASDSDFFPLTVVYQEKYYAAGKFPGGFFKREGRPSEKEILTSRLIDRPIRPLFDKKFSCETQVICTVLSSDGSNNTDILALIAASAALSISGLPFLSVVAAVRVGLENGNFVLNPPAQSDSKLDLIVAGTSDAIMMVESCAFELSEEEMLSAVMFGHQQYQGIIDAIHRLRDKVKPKAVWIPSEDSQHEAVNEDEFRKCSYDALVEAYGIVDKQDRCTRLNAVRSEIMEKFDVVTHPELAAELAAKTKNMEMEIVRGMVLDSGRRIDGRDMTTVRPIDIRVGLLPRTHGSALFTRGETQALVVTTLGTGDDAQIIDSVDCEGREHFLLHYNFPPFSVGEVKRMTGPGRREIGHGKLGWKALLPVIPDDSECPYTLRVVSEILESNGSSSMATVCGASLSLMDAGIKIRGAVAGIAMGLVKEDRGYAVLTDILGDEDHLGDMDFKVAGTVNGVTALQMDIKVTGITEDIMMQALKQAKDARLLILDKMSSVVPGPREGCMRSLPSIDKLTIPVARIRDVIGAGGKVIKSIVEQTGAKVSVEDDGTVTISGQSAEKVDAARACIMDIVAEPEAGTVYSGKVVKIMDFGAFVNFFKARDGLVHVSQIPSLPRGGKPSDVLQQGDVVNVKFLGLDDRGKVRLSMKDLD